jgi:non-homologous end joining protein Ku
VYTEKLTKLIEAKVAGEEIVAPPMHEHAQVINLMDALRQSVATLKKTGTSDKAAARPPRKLAPSKAAKPAEGRKRKTS